MYRTRDFIEARDGLIFAVLSNLHPRSGILAHLRYVRTSNGLSKFESSNDAHRHLSDAAPGYLMFCEELDRDVTIVPCNRILHHFEPKAKLSDVMERGEDPEVSAIVMTLLTRSGLSLGLSLEDLGLTGSFLIGAQSPSSDLDLVVYGLDSYHHVIRALLESCDEGIFSLPNEEDWRSIYVKRQIDPAFYSFSEFVWHESRKYNRAKFHSRRFDILSARRAEEISGDFYDHSFKRLGEAAAESIVEDSSLGHDYPARYVVADCHALGHSIDEIVSYTHTFVDQVREGELALCRGVVEEVSGKETHYRILVGSSREAPGEFLKVKKKE